ncbi:methionyl-tRNA formyltransferase [Fructilactobacillus lindneri]|uniref:Methionyl-tRNA formyltransferase n=3 Tax=Fructilactobacillus lindneri TaxID=53444 RepID=A0A0R2JX31_9LACO|nr:methionyl-tRNA formyltransferase [Fructilactobacillus lindneri]KRN79047.1 methionyl-tRNA formyltransferase [Fructilactobacillus lindneri DSM 20690 = JCM 11027]ANZ59847.1 methionyl-tRNA formyltransferase [Fructilactobacillus lindneri]POG98922.1 methionyl-tRNA formyltransferase [Fructilactobacillus lindneri]POH04309.1 methionyl-tRNA formyltransferase [Fructilactobacillus lindneri]
MGTPSFSVPILKALNEKYDILAVVTQPDRPVGRKKKISASPVKQAANDLNLKVLQPEKLSGSEEMQSVIEMQPDFIITAAYGQFLPTKLLNAAQIAAVNVHGSLLPKYRGGAPVQYAIMNGDKETGITIMYMVKGMDAGDIIAQQAVAITETDDTETMFNKLSIVGRDLLLDTLPKIASNDINPIKQDESQVVFSPTIKRSEEKLDFNQTAFAIDCKIRALRPDPTAYAYVAGKRFKFWDTEVVDKKTTLEPGQIVYKDKHTLQLAAGNQTVIQVNEIQPSGKPKKSITDFLNGKQDIKIGDQFIDEK